MNLKLIISIVAILIVGGIIIPLFSYFRGVQKENNKVSKKNSGNKQRAKDDNSQINIETEKNVNVNNTDMLFDFEGIEVCNEEHALLKVTDNEYVAYLEVGGVSFNLLSEEEKIILEENYGKLLNGIDYEFQNFIQSRNLNLDNFINKYTEKVSALKDKLNKIEDKLDIEKDEKKKEELQIEFNKANNQYNYGLDLLDDFRNKYIESQLLERRFYIILKYYHDFGEYDNELSEQEVLECAYNDLMIKANLFIDTFTRNNMSCKVLNGVEIAEVLYNSYNKDDSSSLRIDSAIRSRFNHLCTTSKPIYLKKLEIEKKKVQEEQKALEDEILDLHQILNEKEVIK